MRSFCSASILIVFGLCSLAGLGAGQDNKIRDHRKGYDANMQRAMDSIFGGSSIEQLEIRDHKFNFKPAKITVQNVASKYQPPPAKPGQPKTPIQYVNTVTIKGQFSHFLRLREDDQIRYTIQKVNGRIASINVDVDGGISGSGGLNILRTAYFEHPVLAWEFIRDSTTKEQPKPAGPKSQLAALESALDKVSGTELESKGWQGVARLIIANIAVRADSRGHDGLVWVRKQTGPANPPPPVKPGKK